MNRPNYLNTRPPEEALPVVLQMMHEEGWSQRAVAKRLKIHDRTLYLWIQRNGFAKRFADEKKRAFGVVE